MPRIMVENIAEKKQAIFESTLELIKEHGFHGAPMSLVAKNAGVAAGTIYHYFESKEQLICELYHYNKERITSVLDSSMDADIPCREKFFRIWTHLYAFYVQQPNVLIFFEQFVNSPFKSDRSPDHFKGKLYDFFAEGIKRGHFKVVKPEILVVLTMGSIHATAKLRMFGKMVLSRNDLDRVVTILWDGMVRSTRKGTGAMK